MCFSAKTRLLCCFVCVAFLFAALSPKGAFAQTETPALPGNFTIPAGTSIYCELDESVTSKKKDSETGKRIRAHVWHDVEVKNNLVIKAGTPVDVEISKVKHAGVAGRKGALELSAISTKAIDGTSILLDGGYDKSGHSRVGLSVALFALVAWPLIFLKGKQAELERGVLFDCTVQSDTLVHLEQDNSAIPIINIAGAGAPLAVEVLYEEMEGKDKPKTLPMRISSKEGVIESASIVSVNGNAVKPIQIELGQALANEQGQAVPANIELAELSKHLSKGINRFEVQSGTNKVEVILNVEL